MSRQRKPRPRACPNCMGTGLEEYLSTGHYVDCGQCRGTGVEDPEEYAVCRHCSGTGYTKIKRSKRNAKRNWKNKR